MLPEIIDLQRKIKLDLAPLNEFARRCGELEVCNGRKFSIALIGDSRMKQLNELFRGKKATTDVLSFPHEPDDFDPDKDNLGDIVISAEQAHKQAAENGLDLETEIKQLILHGLIHLCGYDHETDTGQMNTLELELRKDLGID